MRRQSSQLSRTLIAFDKSGAVVGERLVMLDTETTGKTVAEGHRVIEIGCVEVIARRRTGKNFYRRLNPHRLIDADAQRVHGITDADVQSQPAFVEVVEAFIEYIRGATLVIHNAPFDLAFLDMELACTGRSTALREICSVIDTLAVARTRHPGQSNSLDALCRRYGVDTSPRADVHGALIDASLLADVYMAMTSGQSAIAFDGHRTGEEPSPFLSSLDHASNSPLPIIRANPKEIVEHEARMRYVHQSQLTALEVKVRTLRNEVKALSDRVAIADRRCGASSVAPISSSEQKPEHALVSPQTARADLQKRSSELQQAGEELEHVQRLGPNLF